MPLADKYYCMADDTIMMIPTLCMNSTPCRFNSGAKGNWIRRYNIDFYELLDNLNMQVLVQHPAEI